MEKISKESNQNESLVEKLIHAKRYGKANGWRRSELGFIWKKNKDPGFTEALSVDYRELQAYITALQRNKIKPHKSLTVQNLADSWSVYRDAPIDGVHRTQSTYGFLLLKVMVLIPNKSSL